MCVNCFNELLIVNLIKIDDMVVVFFSVISFSYGLFYQDVNRVYFESCVGYGFRREYIYFNF